MREGFVGRIAATHCRGALDSPEEVYAKRVIELARQLEATIVENSHVSLMLYGKRDEHPIRRGVTRVREFLEAGVNVAIGQDDIDDPYYPFGRGDMMELALFMAHAAHLGSPSEIESAYDMITFNGAKAMRLKNYGFSVGDNADLVILKARSVHEALRMQSGCLFVLKNGKKIAENRLERKLNIKAWV
jgi:cytosine deaminase